MIRILKNLTPKEVLLLFFGTAFIVLQVYLDLLLPDYLKEIMLLIQVPGGVISDVFIAGGKMLICALGSMVSAIFVTFIASMIGAGLSFTLRNRLYSQVDSFSMGEINKFSTSSLITRTTNDISQVQFFLAMGLQMLIKAPITAIWALSKISAKNIEWTYATFGGVVVLMIIISLVIFVARPKTVIIQKLTDKLNSVSREHISGIRVVHAYNAEEYQEDKFELANKDLTDTNIFVNKVFALLMPGMQLIMSGLSLAIYWIGAYLIDGAPLMEKAVLFSEMAVFTSYAVQIIISFMMISMILSMLPRVSVSAKRINDVLDTKCSIIDGSGEGDPNQRGKIKFKDVSFSYPDSSSTVNVLEDISFEVESGSTLAIIGATGSGKTTLINLMTRFYDASCGEVEINGVNVRDYSREKLYNNIGYVSQKAVLFKGSVNSNVSYGDSGKTISDEEVLEALDIAQATEFVSNMQGGINAEISRGGTNVSGGQKQRLSIARAIARRPDIYIFDDTFSALDYKTDKVLRAKLKAKTKGATSVIVAQRIGTIMDADKILVLDDGKIVGEGTHKELLSSCAVYLEIAKSQLSKEELES